MNISRTILAGDVGGTKVLLQLSELRAGRQHVLREQRFDSHAYSGLLSMLDEFLAGGVEAPQAACFAVAGPVTGRQARLTNLAWGVDADEISAKYAIADVRLINDFEAVGHGIAALQGSDVATLQAGQLQRGAPCVVLGAGTGLGVALLLWRDGGYEVIATEGGHVDFAPGDELQIGLLRFLQRRFGHVSCERILSGPGLVDIYQFLCEAGGDESPRLRQAMQGGDAAAAISEFALSGGDALAAQALDMFAAIYGAQAGNLALTVLAGGGVYVAGGIAPKIITKLQDGGFMRAFCNKGRYQAFLSGIPVQVVMNPRVGLMGAALAAGMRHEAHNLVR